MCMRGKDLQLGFRTDPKKQRAMLQVGIKNMVPYVAHAIYGTFLVVKKIFMNGRLTLFAHISQLALG